MDRSPESKGTEPETTRAEAITVEDLLLFGKDTLVYIRPVEIDAKTVFGIWGADGVHIGYAPTEAAAVNWAVRQERHPVTVH